MALTMGQGVRLRRVCFAVTRIFHCALHARTAWESTRRTLRFSLHLVNLSAAANTAFAPAKRCMALSFAIGILCLLSMPQIGNIIAHYRICVNRLNVTAAAIRNRRRKIMIYLRVFLCFFRIGCDIMAGGNWTLYTKD